MPIVTKEAPGKRLSAPPLARGELRETLRAIGDRMATTAIETTGSVDQATLDALREGVAGVLADQSGSTDVHAFIDGRNSLDRELWSQAASLGWLGFGIPDQYGGVGMGARGLAILHTELGRQAAPGPYIATLSAAQAIIESGPEAVRKTWLPRIASGEISAAVPATPGAVALTRSGAGVSGTLRCLGARDAAFVLAPAGDAWVIVELAEAEVNATPMWDRTREMIDIRLRDMKPAAILKDGEATSGALVRAMALATAADSCGAAHSVTGRTIAYMKTREQFGQPIAGFQALKHRAADLATKLAVMDEMVAHAINRIVADEPDADIWVSLAKADVTETFVLIATDCVQLHGGVGFTWDYDPHIFLKRARLNEVLVMANPALRDRAAAALAAMTRAGRSALELGL
jgi:alkylation response protein AidB-like acyl-CoA dehydrogenase